jgi:hypothetical protein
MHRLLSLIAIWFLLLLSSRVSAQTLPAGFARNPYGVAGSPGSLKLLSMPATSSFYDWTPKENARYITVRPYCPPRDCDGSKPWEVSNYWFWDAATNQIGHSESDRTKFRDYVLRNKGAIWIIGNEPDSRSQDNLVPAEYVKMYHAYYTRVKQIDSSAKFAIASITGATYHKEFPHMQTFYDAMFVEYKRLYGQNLPFDFWNLHAYYLGWLPGHPRESQAMVDAVFSRIITPFLAYRQMVAQGIYASKPILATEVGLATGNNNALDLTSEISIAFMQAYTNRLQVLVANKTLADFFWFYGGHAAGDYALSSLLQSDWKTPTSLGQAYTQKAREWDRQFGLEQADFTRDTKINIFDINHLFKAIGTTNAALSLDTNDIVGLSDLALFTKIWNFIE